MSTITNVSQISHKGKHYKTEFILNNTPVYIANSLRRSFSSLVPTVTFDDTYYDDIHSRSIKIFKNTSGLHNEFLSHRISYVPIVSENREYFNIQSSYDFGDGSRTFKFSDKDPKLVFKLQKKNNKDMSEFRDKLGLINVKSSDFLIENSDGLTIDNEEFFSKDVFTDDYILLDKLKQDLGDEDGGEELDIHCIPRISMGRFNTRNDPTGTVTYEMIIDESKVENVFEKKKEYLNNERNKKGLPSFTEEEEKQLRTSFNLLDKDRVIATDELGNPSIYKFSVESIGFMNPDSIINNGIGMLVISLKDIQNSFDFKEDAFTFSYNNKIEINMLDSTNVNEGCMIKVIHENHTIGNLLSNIIRNLWCNEGSYVDYPVLKMAAYKMHHPAVEEIEFMLVPNKFTKNQKIEFIKKLYGFNTPIVTNPKENLENKSPEDIDMLLCVLLFQKAINCSVEMILQLKKTDFIKDKELTFDIRDNEEWLNKNTIISGVIDSDVIPFDNIFRIKELFKIREPVESTNLADVSEDMPVYTAEDSPPYVVSDSPPYVVSDSPPYVVGEQKSQVEESSLVQSTTQSPSVSVSSQTAIPDFPEIQEDKEESIIKGITKDNFIFGMTELIEIDRKIKTRFDRMLKTIYDESAEKVSVSIDDFEKIIEFLKSPETAINSTPENGAQVNIQFTIQPHKTSENKFIHKGIKLDYENKKASIFKKTITKKKTDKS
tara:strand:+ start:1219 stop:3366 length:2148 start_codon:yes stop_codon:yes gene_type:complete